MQPDVACPRCERLLSGMNPKRRVRHLANHQLELQWTCQACMFTTPRWRDARRHATQRHRAPPEVRPTYRDLPSRAARRGEDRADRAGQHLSHRRTRGTPQRSPQQRRHSAARSPHQQTPATSPQQQRQSADRAPSTQTSPQAPGTSTPAQGGPQISPLCQDVSWTELEKFLYEPSEEELRSKLLAQPADIRQRLAQALTASLEDAKATPGSPSSNTDGSSSAGSHDSAGSSSSLASSSSSLASSSSAASLSSSDAPNSSISSRGTQTDGQVLMVYGTEAIHLDLRVVGTVDRR